MLAAGCGPILVEDESEGGSQTAGPSDEDDEVEDDEVEDDDGGGSTGGTTLPPGTTTSPSTTTTASTTPTTLPPTATATVSTTDDSDGSSTGDPPPPICAPPEGYYELYFCSGQPNVDNECVCDEECQQFAADAWYEENCCDSCWYVFSQTVCSENYGDQCCYVASMIEEGCGKGRPLFVDGSARTAEAASRPDWSLAAAPAPAELSAEQRVRLANYWTDVALAEHASVASFARFILDLSAMGAPATLLQDAATALQDEIRHAQIAFGLAGRYTESPIGPTPLRTDGVATSNAPREIILAAVREGCIGETLAAAEAELAAQRSRDPAVAEALRSIADDEARHAALAWRFVQWALGEHPEVADLVALEFAAAGFAAVDNPDIDADHALEAHGMLSAGHLAAMRSHTLEETIRPCAAALLA